jgi:hypothetical protein
MALGSSMFGNFSKGGLANGFQYNPSGTIRFAQGVGDPNPDLKYAGSAGGLLTGLMSGLNSYGRVAGMGEELAQRDTYKRQMGNINDMIANGDYAGASRAISRVNPEYGAQLAMQHANLTRQDRLTADENDFRNQELAMRERQLANTENYRNAMLGFEQKKADSLVNLTPYEKAAQQAQAKNDIAAQKGVWASEQMRPNVEEALDRALSSLDSGTGLGPVGGRLTKFGANWRGGAENYANIESANTQMNTFLRQKLQSTGLTGTELNSAIEAQAYRYTISPTDNEAVVRQKILNFKRDVMGEGTGQPQASMPAQQNGNDPLGIL